MSGRRRSSRATLAAAALGLVVAVTAVVVLVRLPGRRDASGPAAPDPGVLHVHGLGVDPADGTLYAATHTGLFRIPEQGTARRVADRWQDTMGFTVVGPRRFLGSGHPDLDEYDRGSGPPLLGLVESTDGGESWRRLSLGGVADFHDLEVAGDTVYGYDSTSGALMATTDRSRWDTRAHLALRDFAVDPAAASTLVAVTDRGLARSDDGGRTFAPVTAPAPAVLAWPAHDTLLAITTDARVVASADGGTTWTNRGTAPGPPEAFAAAGDALYVATHGGVIHVSRDGGRTWQVRYRNVAPS